MAYLISAYAVSLLGAAVYAASLIAQRRRILRQLSGARRKAFPGGAGRKIPAARLTAGRAEGV